MDKLLKHLAWSFLRASNIAGNGTTHFNDAKESLRLCLTDQQDNESPENSPLTPNNTKIVILIIDEIQNQPE